MTEQHATSSKAQDDGHTEEAAIIAPKARILEKCAYGLSW